AVAVRILVHELERIVVGFDARDREHRPEDLVAVGIHLGRHVVDERRAEEETVTLDLELPPVGDAAEPLVAAIKERLPGLKIGPGLEPENEMGPLITREHRDKVASFIENAPGEGATVVVDGREGAPDGGGFFLAPSLIDDVKPEMELYIEEIFGPVLGVTRVDTYDEALALVNENSYGNGTAIFTRDGGVARRFQFDVQAGMVGVNVPIPVPVAYYSFGGWKASLFGDTHIYGPEGITFYTRGKVVTSRWPDPATSKVDLGFPQTR
ncbi:MAG: malonate-semialdehyde dehydrogenase (acetylating) / methylmalonate-semialdehyde dehydrogenase, partial [Gaiellaceae bacterium]|nr:malonate-semialdehyde dehydrogenase (acetylating) / methylmalonate-semialdehyde dehydrogenase [Gaiellaceae bacterium]